MLQTIKPLAVGALVAAGVFLLIDSALSIPDVHFSYSTDACVTDLNYAEGDNYSCENLPSKFNHVWIK